MSDSLFDPYGAFAPALLFHGLKDRLAGRPGQAVARWGHLRPPAATGKVIWVVGGRSPDSVKLGVELVRAIRAKRLDIRLVFTFEYEDTELLRKLEDAQKTGWGFGPSDHPRAVKRVWERFSPYGVIFAGTVPRPNLARVCAKLPRVLVVGASPPGGEFFPERAYPANDVQAAAWAGREAAPPVDFYSLLVEAQVDPNFRTLVNGAADRRLWWLHSDDGGYVEAFLPLMRQRFPGDVLFVSGLGREIGQNSGFRISRWDRQPMPAGVAVVVDEEKWLPAVAAACTAAHFQTMDARLLWQAMAGGSPVSCAPGISLPKADLAGVLGRLDKAADLADCWQDYAGDPIRARRDGDAARRRFWEERRLAGQINEELLQRVFEW